MKLFKRLIGLMANKASMKQYYLEIGAHFLRKGAGYDVGTVISYKTLPKGNIKVEVIKAVTYDFGPNKISHKSTIKIIKK